MTSASIKRACIEICALLLMLGAADEAARADSFTFPQIDETTMTRELSQSSVRIFRTSDASAQDGSGFVVDSEAGLIVSAAHVVRGARDAVWVSFANSSDLYKAIVLLPKAAATGTDDQPDIAVLKLEHPESASGAFEVQFDTIDVEHEHRVTGFGRDSPSPLEATGKPGRQSDCNFVIRSPTLHGDSGSAVLTDEGLVDGIAVEGRESGGTSSMAETVVLPMSCVRDVILPFIPDQDTEKILDIFRSGDARALRNAFQPPVVPPRGVNNLRLAKALIWGIAERRKNGQFPVLADPQRMLAVMPIIVERRLGYTLLRDFTLASSTSKFAAGDAFQILGDTLRVAGSKQDAAQAYTEARNLYWSYAASLVPNSWSAIDGKVDGSLDVAKAYKAAADSMTKRGNLTKNEDDYRQAATLAAAAIFHAPDGPLKASSWATLGSASQAAGDVSVAAPAYDAAIKEGVSTLWAKNGLKDSRDQLGTKPALDLDAGFLANRANEATSIAKAFGRNPS
ncbi:S1 family peptidase [Labrys monachus]|uniref:Tetratricopeptide (TPR) repeat protein n=1 Tax=Labrys monachus TaxID=217067 RepID=A0ABU0FA19_9HYPH|nr:serine protease [Labrys monachus]MDQ0391467.1 tetratricopeptide (TPR) repeat protein [Labrys monachus]